MKTIVLYLTLPLLALFGVASATLVAQDSKLDTATGTLETLIVARGAVTLNLDLNRLNGAAKQETKMETLRLDALEDSFFPILVMNDELRGPKLGVMALKGQSSPALPVALQDAFDRLVVEKVEWGQDYDLVVRDGKTGFVFFNIEGHHYGYDNKTRAFQITEGRLLLSDSLAKNLGRPQDAGTVVGDFAFSATMRPIEVSKVVNGEVTSAVLPGRSGQPEVGTVPGPDVIVGDIIGVSQGGSSGNFVGLGVGTTSCNAGVVDLNWFQMPNPDHPVIPQNMYRMSANGDRFEQIGQSWLKHAFTALTQNICNFGCNGTGGTRLGSGCSDPYTASLNYSQSGLGSRAWVNPFTGVFPGTARDHSGHTETGISHRLIVAMSDLNPAQNPGATYYAEGQYVTPHEYAWCQSHPGECNQYNNVSYRQYTPVGTTSFTFNSVGTTQRTKPAITAWSGATIVPIEPAPGVDGIGSVAYKVTNPSAGVWHYEYAIYNQTIDRAIQAFTVPVGCGAAVTNVGFRAPTNEAGSANDGTQGSAGYSNAPWTSALAAGSVSWKSETLAQNPNANALRWGTLYNYRFDSNSPPTTMNAVVGFYKTGSPITVQVQAPSATCTPLTFASAVSRKTHGTAGTFDIPLPLSGAPGIENRSGGANNEHTLVFTFSNNVVSGSANVTSGAGTAYGPGLQWQHHDGEPLRRNG